MIDESHPELSSRIRKTPDRQRNPYPCIRFKTESRRLRKKPLAMETGAGTGCYWMEQSKTVNYGASEWAKVCNEHLPLQNQVDHRSYETGKAPDSYHP